MAAGESVPQLNREVANAARHKVAFCGELHVQSFGNALVWTPCYAELRGTKLRIERIVTEGAGSF